METAYRGGWFGNQQSATGESPYLKGIQNLILATGLFITTGTGVYADDVSRLRQQPRNESALSNPLKVYSVETKPERTPAEQIDQIRGVLSPAVSDLAKSFGVSRQTIYNWLNGEQPKPEHTIRLREFALAADLFAESGIPVNSATLKRKIIKGKNLFEIVSEGGSARDAAQILIQIVQREISQRERLDARLAGRKIGRPSADSDIMAANDEV